MPFASIPHEPHHPEEQQGLRAKVQTDPFSPLRSLSCCWNWARGERGLRWAPPGIRFEKKLMETAWAQALPVSSLERVLPLY